MPSSRPAAAALLAVALVLSGAAAAGAAVPTTENPPVYDEYAAVSDPGATAADYFSPLWYDTDGRHIQAHGGQILTQEENGQTVYYWYGEDRSNGYANSPGVSVYRSTDTFNWENLGTAMRTITAKSQLTDDAYFRDLYGTVGGVGVVDQAKVDDLAFHLDVDGDKNDDGTQDAYQAIVERPKVVYNDTTRQYVMWWHSDGNTSPTSTGYYNRSLAAVATSDSPTGPFKLVGSFRMPAQTDYKSKCTSDASVGGARDMTVFKDADGSAYIVYSSENNWSLYIAKLDDTYTSVVKTTTADQSEGGIQYSEWGLFPALLDNGQAGSPVLGEDYTVVKKCLMLEAPAMFTHDGRYYLVTSAATGWSPNSQSYYTADSIFGPWTRGIDPNDAYENVRYQTTPLPAGTDGVLSIGDTRSTTFGSQGTNVLGLDAGAGQFVYMGDRWNAGKADSTYPWLPLSFGENGKLELRNPATEGAQWADGWGAEYWDTHGGGGGIWSVTDARLPESVPVGEDLADTLPATVAVKPSRSAPASTDVAVTWKPTSFATPGTKTITGTLAGSEGFAAGRTFTRTVKVDASGIVNLAPAATVTASSRANLAATLTDGSYAKGWDDWLAGGTYPKDSTIDLAWSQPHLLSSIVVNTYKDGTTASWPSRIGVSYRGVDGTWKTSSVSAAVAQNASGAAPVVTLDVSALPATSAVRLLLHTDTNVWQSLTEVEAYGYDRTSGSALATLTAGGDLVKGFSAGVSDYTAPYAGTGAYPTVAWTLPAGSDAEVTAVQASSADPTAVVTVRDLDAGQVVGARFYRVTFAVDKTLASVTVDGAAVPGVSPGVSTYTVDVGGWGSVPAVSATPSDPAQAVVVETSLTRARISVGAENPAVYTVVFTATGACTAPAAPWRTTSWGNPGSFCASQDVDDAYRVTDAANRGVWTDHDNLTALWQAEALSAGESVSAVVSAPSNGGNSDPRAGIIVRNDLTSAGQGTARGYALLNASKSGVYLQHDADGNGYIETEGTHVGTASFLSGAEVQLKLTRTDATTLTGYYRVSDADEWSPVGTVALASPDAELDAGLFSSANNALGPLVATFQDVVVGNAPVQLAQPTVIVATRCVAGRVYLATTVTNKDEVPVRATVATVYGQSTIAELAPGASRTALVAVRKPSVPAGVVTVTATAEKDGTALAAEREASYSAITCAS